MQFVAYFQVKKSLWRVTHGATLTTHMTFQCENPAGHFVCLYWLQAVRSKHICTVVSLCWSGGLKKHAVLIFNYLHRPHRGENSPHQSNILSVLGYLEEKARKKHISYRRYSHFFAEDSDTLVFWAASLFRQTELFLIFGVLLFQCLELKTTRQRQ